MVAGFDPVGFHDFHRNELPQRLAAGNAELAAVELARLPSLAIRVREEAAAYTYRPTRDARAVEIVPGDAAADLVVEIDRETFEGLALDCETPPGMIYGGRVEKLRGDMMDFVAWEPALRAMFHGRPIYDPQHGALVDLQGARLDPRQAFAPDSDRDEMAHFLRSAGYLLVRRVFDAAEVARFREAATLLRAEAIEGDQESWWGRNVAGDSVLCRVLSAGRMPAFSTLAADPRLARLAELADVEMQPGGPIDGVTVLWKNPDMKDGLSDLPWHRDCGMGGHATMCPTMVCSIHLEANCDEAGALRFLPGSWNTSYGFREATDRNAPEGVRPPAEAGDVTLHYGDGLHVAPAPTSPTGPFRTSVLVGFRPLTAYNHRGERHYNDVLLGAEDGQIEHMTKIAGRH